MIELVGTLHDDVAEDPNRFFDILANPRYDQLFVEGMSSQAIEDERNRSEDVLIDFVKGELEGAPSEEDILSELNELNQGPEPGYIEEEWMDEVNQDSIVFLDEKRSFKHLEVLMTDALRSSQDRWDVEPISEDEMADLMENNEDSREDYLKFLRYALGNFSDTSYGAIESSSNFPKTRWRIGKNYFDSKEKEFVLSLADHDIGKSEFQKLIEEERESWYQDDRDEVWYNQISDYLEENPEEDVMVVAGLAHMIEADNTLRDMLEQDYEVEVKPFYPVNTTDLPYSD